MNGWLIFFQNVETLAEKYDKIKTSTQIMKFMSTRQEVEAIKSAIAFRSVILTFDPKMKRNENFPKISSFIYSFILRVYRLYMYNQTKIWSVNYTFYCNMIWNN